MIARRPTRLGANSRPVPSISIARPSRLSPSANARATYSNCSGRVNALAAYTRYVHTTEVLASTRSPWLNTGPLPANRFRTVRSTISPSSAIQRRCQAPQPNSTATTATLAQRLARTVRSKGKEGRPTDLSTGQRDAAGGSEATSAEDDCGTYSSDPGQEQHLQHPVVQRDVLGFAGHTAVDVHREAQDCDRERHHRHHEPAHLAVFPVERPQAVADDNRGGRQCPDEPQVGAGVALQRLADPGAGTLGQLQLGVTLSRRYEQRPERQHE